MEENGKKFEDLKFVRLTEPGQFNLIPRYLFEQVKDEDLIIDRVYQYGPHSLAHPFTFFHVLVEKDTALIKGFLWAEIDVYTNILFVNIFSVDREYQGDDALKITLDFAEKIQEEQQLTKIQMITPRPEACEARDKRMNEKPRLKRSKITILEIQPCHKVK